MISVTVSMSLMLTPPPLAASTSDLEASGEKTETYSSQRR